MKVKLLCYIYLLCLAHQAIAENEDCQNVSRLSLNRNKIANSI
jgi:hypothetical protein